MKTCKLCGSDFPLTLVVDGVKRNLQRRKFCLTCSPLGSRNTRTLRYDDGGKICVVKVSSDTGDLTCSRCQRVYAYDKKQGHTLTLCNSCVANRQRIKVKKRCVEYKGGKCQECGYSGSMRGLGFHHRDRKQKEFTLSQKMSWSWNRLVTELDKCDILCARCHMEEEEKNASFVQRQDVCFVLRR